MPKVLDNNHHHTKGERREAKRRNRRKMAVHAYGLKKQAKKVK